MLRGINQALIHLKWKLILMTRRSQIFILPHPGPDGVHSKVFKNHFAVSVFDKKLKTCLIIETNRLFLSSASKQ